MAPTQEMAAPPGTSTANGSAEPRDDSQYVAHNLIMSTILPMSVKAFIELGIADILAFGKEPMSAEEIAAKLPTTKSGTGSALNLKRLLRPLVREEVVSESVNDEKKPVYGLTKISKWFTRDNELDAVSFAGLHFCTKFQSVWPHMKEVVVDDAAIPFQTEFGMPYFDYTEKDPEFGSKFHDAMLSLSKLQFREVVDHLQHSGVLEGVKTLVDVGGGRLATIVGHVVAQNPQIQGINFDLPHVIATAPSVKGVEHRSGDFFKAVPSGDAVFMKMIIHNYGDEESVQILKNCFEALPSNGKVILAEYVLKDGQEQSPVGRFTEFMDLIMMALHKKGKERTQEEYRLLMEAAGFSHFGLIVSPGGMDFVQAIKD